MSTRAAILALLAVLVAAPALAAPPGTPLAVGDRAPDIALADQHGKPFALADALAQRRFMVVAFYVKAFTSG